MKPSFHPAIPAFMLGLALGSVAGSWTQRAMFHRMMRSGPDPRRIILACAHWRRPCSRAADLS